MLLITHVYLWAEQSRRSSLVPNTADAAISEGIRLTSQGRIVEASRAYTRAAALARRNGDPKDESKALIALSGCRIRLFDYRGAQRAAEEARPLALKAKNKSLAGGAAINLATIYLQVGDFPLAENEAGRATELLKDVPNKEYYAKALLLYANIEAERRDLPQIQRNYLRAVEVAHKAGQSALEAIVWEELGESLLLANAPESAQDPLRRAYLLESSNRDEGALAVNKEHQAELQLEKQNYPLGLKLINEALASKSDYFKINPQYFPLRVRGVLLEHLNRKPEALNELRKAVDAATEWRQGALPGDATSTRTVAKLQTVYQDYAQLAAELSLENHDPALAREGLEALAENRAANLREQITLAFGQKLRLPPRYYDLLSELQSAQARVTLGESSQQDRVKLDQIRLELGGIENGFGLEPKNLSRVGERNRHRNSLRDIQGRLSGSEVLLSFCLGQKQSFLWAMTRDRVSLYRLPGENEIGSAAKLFSQAVQGRQDPLIPGRRLSEDLFGSLQTELWRKPDWLIVADGVLLDGVPFPSLPDISKPGKRASLTDSHNLRFLPGELLLLAPETACPPQKRFLGVGDPVYNMADARRKKELTPPALDGNRASLALARLPGSDKEVRTAARESGLAQSQILVGQEATLGGLEQAISKDPEIVHFAVHVVSADTASAGSPGESSQAALALSLTSSNMPELLTPEAIATLRVPGSLIILSGCSSEKGEILPGAGLMGLSRAWLLAGASAVVVSAWPTPDDSGKFFSSFYSHFDAMSSGTLAQRAAVALQEAQIDMQRSGGYRSSPKFWAAYSIISKE